MDAGAHSSRQRRGNVRDEPGIVDEGDRARQRRPLHPVREEPGIVDAGDQSRRMPLHPVQIPNVPRVPSLRALPCRKIEVHERLGDKIQRCRFRSRSSNTILDHCPVQLVQSCDYSY